MITETASHFPRWEVNSLGAVSIRGLPRSTKITLALVTVNTLVFDCQSTLGPNVPRHQAPRLIFWISSQVMSFDPLIQHGYDGSDFSIIGQPVQNRPEEAFCPTAKTC
jgi:hypothetical protein